MSQKPFNSDGGFNTSGNTSSGNITVTASHGNLVLGDATATASPGLSSTTSLTFTADRGNTNQSMTLNTSGNLYIPGSITTGGSGGDITLTSGNITGADNIELTGNISLNGGYIQSGTTTIVNDGINSISIGPSVTIDVFAFPFTTPTRGQLTISGDISTTQALGTWYYQSVNTNTVILYTDSTYSATVDSSSWTPYTGGGSVAIQENLPAGNIVLNANGYLSTFTKDGNLVVPGGIELGTGSNLVLSSGSIVGTGASPAPSINGFDSIGAITLSASGNITGSYFIGNGSQLTGLPASYGDSNVATLLAGFGSNTISTTGNIAGNYILGNIAYANGIPASYGNSNVTTLLSAYGSNTISTTGNVTVGNIITGGGGTRGLYLGNVNARIMAIGSNSYATFGQNITLSPDTALSALAGIQIGGNGYLLAPNGARVLTLGTDGSVTVNANINQTLAGYQISTAGNIVAAGFASAVGNVKAGNVTTVGQVSATGNITTAGNFVGNGAALTNVTVSVAGNIIGTQSNVTLVAGSYNYTFDNTGNLTLPANGDLVFSGNTTLTSTSGSNGNVTVNPDGTGQFVVTAITPAAFGNTVSVAGNVTVSGTGAISMPNLPAFRVYGNGVTNGLNVTTNGTGVLNGNNWAVDYNQGNVLNSTTGVFTAPVAGLYQVNLVARCANNTTGTAQAIVIKNYGGANVNQAMWEVAANTTVNHFGVSTVSKLAVGDTLTLKVTVGNIAFDVNDNWSVAFLG